MKNAVNFFLAQKKKKNRVTWSESDRVCRSFKCFHLLPAVPLTHDPSMFLFPFSFPVSLSFFFLSFCFPLFFFSPLPLSLSLFFLSLAPLRKAKFVESPRIPESELGSPTLTSAQKLDVDAYCPGKRACQVSALKEGGLDQAHPAEQRFACILFIKSQLFSLVQLTVYFPY